MSLRLQCARRFALGVAVLVSCSSDALARDYYISATGSDTAAGTLAQPFRTIQRAASVMVAGDTAYIRTHLPRAGSAGQLRVSGRAHQVSAVQRRNGVRLRRRRDS